MKYTTVKIEKNISENVWINNKENRYTTFCTFSYPDLCGEDWIQFSSSCYFNSKDNLMTWHDARQFCRENGAALTSIHDSDELHFLITLVLKRSCFLLTKIILYDCRQILRVIILTLFMVAPRDLLYPVYLLN